MSTYKLRFMFDYHAHCIWGVNSEAIDKYGCNIKKEKLHLSETLISELTALEDEYHTLINWDCPLSSTPWTEEHKADFIYRTNAAYIKVKNELGEDFEIELFPVL